LLGDKLKIKLKITREEVVNLRMSAEATPKPMELIFVRHGESEGNVAVEAGNKGDYSHYTDEFRSKHNCDLDLTERGIGQANKAGLWIKENINNGIFDGYYVSTYKRARKTAGYLGLPNALWNVRDYIREHDWGNLDAMTFEERWQKYPDAKRARDINPYYSSAPGGESLADVVIRVRVGILSTVYRVHPNERVIIVSHGNILWPIRIIMEGLLPEQYLTLKELNRKSDKINNCQILQYSRINPKTGEVSQSFNWMRSICPWNPLLSDNNWRTIERRKFTNEELISV
jgi:broad specificity phosphatase PhoE